MTDRRSSPIGRERTARRRGPETPQGRASTGPIGRLLLAEDNDLLRKLVVLALEQHGHVVVAAEDAEEALQLLAAAEAPFDLLVTDLVLPGINGYELAERVLTASPGMRVLFVSGYATPGTQPPIHGAAAAHFLQKPYSPAEIVAAVIRVLTAAPHPPVGVSPR